MNQNSRYGFKWSINEILSLQREFELLGWSIDQIAEKHKRSASAIMYKLDQEGFADYNVLYSNYHNLNATIPLHMAPELSLDHDDDDDDDNYDDDSDSNFTNDALANLSDRVYGLEESVSEIRDMLKQMMQPLNRPLQSITF